MRRPARARRWRRCCRGCIGGSLIPIPTVRAATPHWLVVVLPQRTLVEQTVDSACAWVKALGAAVGVHVLMGGEDSRDHEWKMHPDTERIFVGTQDMVLSRLLMRGFAEFRSAWPMSFGLLHAGVQFVFDEVQLIWDRDCRRRFNCKVCVRFSGPHRRAGRCGCRPPSTWPNCGLWTCTGRYTAVDVTEGRGELARRMAATRTIRRLDLGADPKQYPAADSAEKQIRGGPRHDHQGPPPAASTRGRRYWPRWGSLRRARKPTRLACRRRLPSLPRARAAPRPGPSVHA